MIRFSPLRWTGIVFLLLYMTPLLAWVRFPASTLRKTACPAVRSIYSKEELDSILKQFPDKLIVVDYSTTWCVPCKAIEPKYTALSELYPNVLFLKCVDGDPDHSECAELMMREGIRSVPAFHFWKEGSKQEIITGARIEDVEFAVKSIS